MTNVVRLRRKVRPLKARYDPTAPFIVERTDNDDEENTITYEVVDSRPETYRILCFIHEDPGEDRAKAKQDAELIARALNFRHQYLKGSA